MENDTIPNTIPDTIQTDSIAQHLNEIDKLMLEIQNLAQIVTELGKEIDILKQTVNAS